MQTKSHLKEAHRLSLLGCCYIALGEDFTGFNELETCMEKLKIISKFIVYPEMIQTHLYVGNGRVHGGNQLEKAYQHLLFAQKHAIKMDLLLMQTSR